jgi:hypothetical protein
MKFSLVFLYIISLLISGCAQDVANRYYASEKYPEKQSQQVELLYKRPKREFEVIADFQSRNESAASIRKKAAKIGADAVIVTSLGGSYSFSDEWANNDSQSHTSSRMVATAIKYK